VELTPAAYDDPVAAALIEAVQQEYELRYGGRDATPLSPAEFSPPLGLFLVGRVAGEPVACGGWRVVEPGLGEIKRMYVVHAHRRHGLSRLVLAELERTAVAAGLCRLRLETGWAQPEALALYESSGYTAIEKFGVYRDEAGSHCYGKTLS
jgi:GNAT superfamily N-acetyltransferase